MLEAMLNAGYITEEQRDEAASEPAVLLAQDEENAQSNLGYVFDVAIADAYALLPEPTPDLVIRTTLDMRLQRAAEQAVEDVLIEEGEEGLASQGSLAALGSNGEVLALVGGRSYADSKFNRAVQALRQPGSAFKAFVFAAAFEEGLSPGMMYEDKPIDYDGWQPENYGGGFSGPMSLREAFKHSINTVSAQVVFEIGPEKVADLGSALRHPAGIRALSINRAGHPGGDSD